MDFDGTNVSFVFILSGAELSGADPGVSPGLCSLCFLHAQPLGLILVMLVRRRERLKWFGRTALKGKAWQSFRSQKHRGELQASGELCPTLYGARPAKPGTAERGNE